ncbi:MAG: hypothetical protein ACRCTQ_00230 [Brevinemataceae bacterium]
MKIKYYLLIIILSLPSMAFSWDLNGWVSYEQQFGALDNKFITYGGSSAGILLGPIAIGVGLYGNFPYKSSFSQFSEEQNLTAIYGGGIIGYSSPEIEDILGIRLNVLLGYGSLDIFSNKTGHFIVSPSLYFDLYIIEHLALSFGLTYRYFHNAPSMLGINKPENSFAGSISISWIDHNK